MIVGGIVEVLAQQQKHGWLWRRPRRRRRQRRRRCGRRRQRPRDRLPPQARAPRAFLQQNALRCQRILRAATAAAAAAAAIIMGGGGGGSSRTHTRATVARRVGDRVHDNGALQQHAQHDNLKMTAVRRGPRHVCQIRVRQPLQVGGGVRARRRVAQRRREVALLVVRIPVRLHQHLPKMVAVQAHAVVAWNGGDALHQARAHLVPRQRRTQPQADGVKQAAAVARHRYGAPQRRRRRLTHTHVCVFL